MLCLDIAMLYLDLNNKKKILHMRSSSGKRIPLKLDDFDLKTPNRYSLKRKR